MKSQTVIAFLLGAVIALSSAVVVMVINDNAKPAYAVEAGGTGLFGMVGQGFSGQSRDVVFIVDPGSQRLAIYDYKNGSLKCSGVRNIKWDLKFEEFPGRKQSPSVQKQRKAHLDSEKKGK
jgi:hypothetical protein